MFFVTFGQKQGEHTFDEGITAEGVLTWRSQPRQALDDPRILQWISHNELVNNIYLFLRTTEDRKYGYFGRLKYLDHDSDRERPVFFHWQILEWSILPETISALGLRQDAMDRKLGYAGEVAILAKEREYLRSLGRQDLAEKVAPRLRFHVEFEYTKENVVCLVHFGERNLCQRRSKDASAGRSKSTVTAQVSLVILSRL